MNRFFKSAFSAFILAIFVPSALASTKVFPSMLCVDAENYWDGAYTIEVNQLHDNSETFAEIYDQSPEGRFVVAKVQIEKQTTSTELFLIGEKFELRMHLPDTSKPSRAHVKFSNEYGFLDEDYMCLFF